MLTLLAYVFGGVAVGFILGFLAHNAIANFGAAIHAKLNAIHAAVVKPVEPPK